MNDNEALTAYIQAHSESEPEWLAVLDRDANVELMNARMNSGHLQGRLLKMLTKLIAPRRVLELGTFGGYSALCIAEGLSGDATVTTVEIDDEKEEFIRRHIEASPYASRIRLLIADAMEILPDMTAESFDMIFLDSDKRDYPALYPLCKRLLAPGGLLIADNVLWDGHIADAAYDRDKQTVALRRFNEMVATDAAVEAVIIPLRDGLSLIRKKNLLSDCC